jgi:hypothetical protein
MNIYEYSPNKLNKLHHKSQTSRAGIFMAVGVTEIVIDDESFVTELAMIEG